MMTERVARLRRESLDAKPSISTERAMLVTEAYAGTGEDLPAPLRRAAAFRHLMERKTIYIGEGELIVGEKGPSAESDADLPRALLPQPRGSRPPRFAREDSVRREPGGAENLRREDHPFLARQNDP